MSILKDSQDEITSFPVLGKCERVGIAAESYYVIDEDLRTETLIRPNELWRGSTNPSWFIIERLKNTDFIQYPPTKDISQEYFIKFKAIHKTYSTTIQHISFWVSDLAAGIIPGWGDGTFYLSSEIFDKGGKKIADYESTKIRYTYLRGWIFLPINFGTRTLAYINEQYIPKLTDELISQMIKDKLFKCSKI